MKRKAPKSGYLFEKKEEYRQDIWRYIKYLLKHQNIIPRKARVLLMPSLEGREIEVALHIGFLEKRMYVVDNNPAIVATLKRIYPMIHTYGVDVVRALERIRQEGVKLHAANFDLCGTVMTSRKVAEGIIANLEAFSDTHLVYFTAQRGRESNLKNLADHSFEVSKDTEYSDNDLKRVWHVLRVFLDDKSWPVRIGMEVMKYNSISGLPMMSFGIMRSRDPNVVYRIKLNRRVQEVGLRQTCYEMERDIV